jgi:hypothetical protein
MVKYWAGDLAKVLHTIFVNVYISTYLDNCLQLVSTTHSRPKNHLREFSKNEDSTILSLKKSAGLK